MADYFPTDVSVRIDGDRFGAQLQLGAVRQMLFKAIQMADVSDGKPVQLSQRIGEAGHAMVTIIGGHKIVNIFMPPPVVGVEPPRNTTPEEVPIVTADPRIYMLTGIARGVTLSVDRGVDKLHDFRPTTSTANAFNVPNEYHDNKKLGGAISYINATKPSMFSGAIKRIVQAIHGMGRIRDASGYYLTPPSAVSRQIPMPYTYNWSATHGVYRAGPRNYWLIEISAARGILAMPLPRIPSTRTASYRRWLEVKGDTGGLAVVREFGGLPSGETFPTGTDLTDAITAGRVLRLATAADLNPYYASTVGEAHYTHYGWAFSDSGGQAHNVRFNYKKIVGDPKYSVNAEHWAIGITLSEHNTAAPIGTPVGTGSATLTRLHSGRVNKDTLRNFWGGGSGDAQSLLMQQYLNQDIMDIPAISLELYRYYEGWGAVIHVFFVGDQLERVKFVPPFCWKKWQRQRPRIMTRAEITYYGDEIAYPDGGAPYYGFEHQSGNVGSPGAIISDSVDMRVLAISQYDWVGPGGSGIPIPSYILTFGFPPYFIPNANLDAQLETQSYDNGTGEYDGQPNRLPQYFAVVPGNVREGIVLGRLNGHPAPQDPATMMDAMGIFSGIGVRRVDCDDGFFFRPHLAWPFYFGASINAGPTIAYSMTRGMVKQPGAFALPDVVPGCIYENVLPDTGTPTNTQTHFVGGY